MTVKEVIEELKKYDEEMIVYFQDGYDGPEIVTDIDIYISCSGKEEYLLISWQIKKNSV